jgi:hypothetical protein
MRRLLSILLLLGLAMGPAFESIPAHALASGWTGRVDESKIPACCRRNGKHHCAMGGASASENGQPAFSPVGCCPCMPQGAASVVVGNSAIVAAPVATLRETAAPSAALPEQDRALNAGERTEPQRGPPASLLL